MNDDGKKGIGGVDDDGDGFVDELSALNEQNDDEDLYLNEDPVDGIDNDGDGNIDEDCGGDLNNDDAPGIAGIDDDGDGQVDEGSKYDDDEDGSLSETGLFPIMHTFENATNRLLLEIPSMGLTRVLAERVTFFQVTYEAPQRILIELTLTDEDGENVAFSEYVFPRNTLQKTGKRVR
jgi:hypothetical protein